MKDFSYITNSHPSFIEGTYNQFLQDPNSIDPELKKFFEGFDFAIQNAVTNSIASTNTSQSSSSVSNVAAANVNSDSPSIDWAKEINVYRLILGYRNKGHLIAKTNPIRERKDRHANLDLHFFELSDADLTSTFYAGNLIGLGATTLHTIVEHLQNVYAKNIGIEYKYISDQEKVDWLTNEMEHNFSDPIHLDQKRRILEKLNQGVIFEKFLHTKYIGQKRFSLEGGEATIAALDAIINIGADHGVEEVVIGMAHRGRLNILANIMGKTYEQIFSEFEGTAVLDQTMGSGDVKYHMGYSSEIQTPSNKNVHLKLMQNPSHLEAVDPVVLGFARAKADVLYENNFNKVLPILIHGDASVAGQGVVYEVLQMAGLKAYNVGGCIHIVTNNQIGFTTNYIDARTSTYCTDVAKTTLCPVFHVNADDVEAVVYTVKLALEYRQEFNSDVFIDLLGYRKYGHNEGDEPRFTQPLLYKAIATHQNPREIYNQKLLSAGSVEADLAKEMDSVFRKELQAKLESAKAAEPSKAKNFLADKWKGFRSAKQEDFEVKTNTAVGKEMFLRLADKITGIPKDFKAFSKIEKLFNDRKNMIKNDNYDWAMGELMAYATLSNEGHSVRMTGQDCERGTFSHRHAIIKQEDSELAHNVIDSLGEDKKGNVEFYNSLLSEYAVLGFEYGYSMFTPNDLIIWEAQFGDFGNGAQIIIDQYLASAETKWKTYSGLTLMLPHGYEGQGPEHSSARLERFLQLCANWNMQVCNITTPANYFHALRRQLKRDFRLPLVVMTPKSLLRHPLCVSKLADFTEGTFEEVIDDAFVTKKSVKRVLLCTGKIYFELLENQQKYNRKDVAIVRVEQLYPMPEKQLAAVYEKYKGAEFCWVQEEPKNMGAWLYLLRWDNNMHLKRISRESSASPATGFSKVHAKEQAAIIDQAFSI
jgi:2-oxoglutarate dehydrogenase E1 component